MKKSTKLILMLILGTLFSISAYTQATYYWIGKATGTGGAHDWQIADNWDPQRSSPATDDILIFDARHAGFQQDSVNNIPVQNIGTLKFDSGMFFFEAAGDSARLNISTLLSIDRYGGIDLKGWTNPHPVNIWMDVNSIGTVNGTIIANNFVQLDGSLTTIGANYSYLTRKAKFVDLAPGSWLTLESSNPSLATELEVEDTIRLGSTNDKYASLLMKGVPVPNLYGCGIHLYDRYLFDVSKGNPKYTTQRVRQNSKPAEIRLIQKTCENCEINWYLMGPHLDSIAAQGHPCTFRFRICHYNPTSYFFVRFYWFCDGAYATHLDPSEGWHCQNLDLKFNPHTTNEVCFKLGYKKSELDSIIYNCPGPCKDLYCYDPLFIYDEQTANYLPLGSDELFDYDLKANNGEFHNVYENASGYTEVLKSEGKFHNGFITTGLDSNQYQITGTYIQPWNLFNGWNLMGNPYPSSMNWGTDSEFVEGWTRIGIYNSFYVWNMDLGQYAYFNGSGDGDSLNGGMRYIAPCQGFWIRADSTQSNYQLATDNRVRCHSNTPFLKSTGKKPVNSLRVKVNGNGSSDELIVKFDNRATLGIDAFDTYKIYGDKYAPQIYTVAEDNKQMSINTYPEILKSLNIPMGFYIDTSGRFNINFSQISSFSGDVESFFEDLKTGSLVKLQDGYEYPFDYKKGDDANRFVIHFNNKSYGTEEKETESNIHIYSFDDMIYIRNYTGLSGDVYIYDITGRMIMHRELACSTFNKFSLDASAGCYFVKVITGNKAYNRKVCLD